jgi:serine/threonine protein kinase
MLCKFIREWSEKDFIDKEFLSKGKYGAVYKCKETNSGKVVALKVMKKEVIEQYNMIKQLRREIEIQSHLKYFFFFNKITSYIKTQAYNSTLWIFS